VGRDRVAGEAVERVAAPVIPSGGRGVGVAGTVLDVAERNAGVERQGDEAVAQRIRRLS
jgi:hypothetical protein